MVVKRDLVLPAEAVTHLRQLFQSCQAANHMRRLDGQNIPPEEAVLLLVIGNAMQDVRWRSSETAFAVIDEACRNLSHPLKDRAGVVLSMVLARRDAGWACEECHQLLLALTLATYFLMIPPTIPDAQEHATVFASTLPGNLWGDFESFLYAIIGFVEENHPKFDPVFVPKKGHEGAPPVIPVNWSKPN